MDTNVQIQQLRDELGKLKAQIENLSSSFYKNNFSNTQFFNKGVIFQSSLKVPSYSSAPTVCEVGEIIEIAGVLYICTVANTTWTVVGTQV